MILPNENKILLVGDFRSVFSDSDMPSDFPIEIQNNVPRRDWINFAAEIFSNRGCNF